jgi:hypothetical protein
MRAVRKPLNLRCGPATGRRACPGVFAAGFRALPIGRQLPDAAIRRHRQHPPHRTGRRGQRPFQRSPVRLFDQLRRGGRERVLAAGRFAWQIVVDLPETASLPRIDIPL